MVAEAVGLASQLAASAAGWPVLSAPARQLALRVHAALLLDASLDTTAAIALAAAAQAAPVRSASAAESSPRLAPQQDAAVESQPVAASSEATAEPVREGGESPPQTDEAAALDSVVDELPTTYAGLFYLLGRLQELDLVDSLWAACLPEGKVLAVALAALLGPAYAADAALALLGGLTISPAPDYGALMSRIDVNVEQLSEVAAATCTALAEALPRRGLAEMPLVRLALAGQGGKRLLVAQAVGSPFVFFAWPAAQPADLQTGLRTFLQIWPQRAGVYASPELAALDAGGRMQAADAGHPAVEPLLPPARTAPTAALLALVVGAPCLLLAVRAGAPAPDTAPAFVARYLSYPARIRLTEGRMDIVLPAEALDFDLRRAGLDRDPGWVPWLRRNVRFVFESPKTADIA